MQAIADVNDIYVKSDYHSVKHGVSDTALPLIIRYRTEKFSRFIRPDDEVLEFGVGPGWNVVSLPARRRVGYDITLTYADRLRASGVEFVSDLNVLAGQTFDVVLLSHVVEHLPNDAETLVDLKSFLKPNGRIVVMVPYEYQRRLRRYSTKDKNFHLHAYNVQTMVNLLRSCGYDVDSCVVKPFGYDRFAAQLAVRFRAGMGLYKALIRLCRVIRPEKEIQAMATLRK